MADIDDNTKNFIDQLSSGNNVDAGEAFKDALRAKVASSLDNARKDVAANFYFSPSRMWELLAGSIAAFIAHHKGVQKNNFLALVGLTAIIFSIFIYDEEIPFPSLYTIVPVFGVVLLVLYADKNTFAAKILSTKVFVGTGLISYSLYLWHQPILAFTRIYKREPLTDLFTYIIILSTLLLAIFTWKFVESPFRNKARFSSARIFGLSSCMIIIFISIGLYLDRSNGAPSRMFTNDAYQRSSHEIKITKVKRIAIEQVENHNINNGHIFIMGDSFAQDIAYQVLAFNKWSGMIEGATHYHADYVNPTWARQLRLVGKIDDHIFYRWD